MKPKIVLSNYDSPTNPFYGGGGAHAIHEVAQRLVARYDVTVVTSSHPQSHDETVDGVRYRRIGSSHAGPRLGQLLFQFLLPIHVRREECVLWVESLTPPFSTACLPLFTRTPVIALTQVLAGRAMSRKYKLPFATLESAGLRTYRYAIALSAHIRTELLRANPRLNTVVIPNGIGRDLFELPVEREGAHILFLGRLDIEQKGLDLLLDAFRSVAAVVRVPLVIAGAGSADEGPRLTQRLRTLGLENQVQAVGRVDGVRKRDLLRRAVFLVMPSRFEASPLVLLEGLASGLPVLLFGIPELADVPDSCCLKVAPFDTTALGQAMLELSRDTMRRQRLGEAAKVFARQFDWDQLARRYEDFFETVLQTR